MGMPGETDRIGVPVTSCTGLDKKKLVNTPFLQVKRCQGFPRKTLDPSVFRALSPISYVRG